MPDSGRTGGRRKKRQPARRQYLRPVDSDPRVAATVTLTEKDLQAFAFLLEPLRKHGFMAPVPKNTADRTNDCPDLMEILRRCKAKGVDLGSERDPGPPRPPGLSGHLLFLLCEESNPPLSVRLNQTAHEADRGAKTFKAARSHFERVRGLFNAPEMGIPASAIFELMDACELMIQRAQMTARDLGTVRRAFESRRGAKATGLPKESPGRPARDSDLQAIGVSRDDARNLRRVVRFVRDFAPIRYGGVSLTHVGYPRCPTCHNPAPALFAPDRNAIRRKAPPGF